MMMMRRRRVLCVICEECWLNIRDLLEERIDIPTIQRHFMSKEALSALKTYEGSEMSFHHNIISLITKQFSTSEMLRQENIRTMLLQSLRPDDAADLARKLFPGSNGSDPYKRLRKTRFTKNGEKECILFEYFNAVPPEDIHPTERAAIDRVSPDMKIHDYQRTAIFEASKHIGEGNRRCLLHMPTGSGKTWTTMRIISSKFLENEPTIILWLAYNEELCEQAVDAFKTIWNRMGDREIPILRFYKHYQPDILELTSRDRDAIIIAGIGKLNSAEKSSGRLLTTLADRVRLVVMDEAHQAVAPVYRSLLEQILDKRPNSVGFIGLSATPGRSTHGSVDPEELPRFFGGNKVTIDSGGETTPIKRLMRDGYQAHPHIQIIPADGMLTEDEMRRIEQHSDIPEIILQKIGKDVRRMIRVVGQVEDLIEAGHKRIIMFAPSVANSRDVSLILSARGHKSFHIDANTPPVDRRNNIKMFKSDIDRVMVMCNYGVLATGFDAPKISAAVIARPTRSSILYSQMAGRAMRGSNVGGNKECEIRVIADFYIPGWESVVDNFMKWEDLW